MSKIYKDNVKQIEKIFVKRMKFLRKKQDITQAVLASRLNISLSTLRHIENAEQRVYLSDAILILSALGVDSIKIDGMR